MRKFLYSIAAVLFMLIALNVWEVIPLAKTVDSTIKIILFGVLAYLGFSNYYWKNRESKNERKTG